MPYSIYLTRHAAGDMDDIYEYVALNDVYGKADRLIENIEIVIASLSENPHRGSFPRELTSIGIKAFREVFSGPYRIIYQVIEHSVFVMLVTDGRRDMQRLLQRRLLS